MTVTSIKWLVQYVCELYCVQILSTPMPEALEEPKAQTAH